MAITGELAPFGLDRLCLHCRCFYNQNKGVVQQRIQEHYQNVRSDHFNLVDLPPCFLNTPLFISCHLPVRLEYPRRLLGHCHGQVPEDVNGQRHELEILVSGVGPRQLLEVLARVRNQGDGPFSQTLGLS